METFCLHDGRRSAVQAWIDKGWGQDVKAETTLTEILTPEKIVTKIDELTAYYKNYFDRNKKTIEVEISAPVNRNSISTLVTEMVEVVQIPDDQIATKECSGGAKSQISQGFGVMAGMHSILNVKPTYADVNGNIYQERDRIRRGKPTTVIKELEQTACYRKGTQTIERYTHSINV